MHFCVIKSNTLKIAAVMLVVAIILALNIDGSTFASVYFGNVNRRVQINRVQREDSKIALTFDATFGEDKAEEILYVLKEFNLKATFFCVGFYADNNPDALKAIHDAGHEIGTLGNTYANMTKLTSDQIKLELTSSAEKIKNITGNDIKYFRAPFKSFNNTVLSICEDIGLTAVGHDVDSKDWQGKTAEQITAEVLKKAKSGSIILFNTTAESTPEAIRIIITSLQKQGYQIVGISDLIYANNYTLNPRGEQILNT